MSEEQEIVAEVMQSAYMMRRIAVAFGGYAGRGGAARAGLEALRDVRRHSEAADTSLRGLDGPAITRAFTGEQRAVSGGQPRADADQLRALREFTEAGRPGAHQATQPSTGQAAQAQGTTVRRSTPNRGPSMGR
jgi:hypothetical protein